MTIYGMTANTDEGRVAIARVLVIDLACALVYEDEAWQGKALDALGRLFSITDDEMDMELARYRESHAPCRGCHHGHNFHDDWGCCVSKCLCSRWEQPPG